MESLVIYEDCSLTADWLIGWLTCSCTAPPEGEPNPTLDAMFGASNLIKFNEQIALCLLVTRLVTQVYTPKWLVLRCHLS